MKISSKPPKKYFFVFTNFTANSTLLAELVHPFICPLPCQFILRPLIGPQITLSVPGTGLQKDGNGWKVFPSN